MRVFYFGCVGESGHHLFTDRLRSVYNEGPPWDPLGIGAADGVLAPHVVGCNKRHCRCPNGDEGVAEIHHKDGWTAMAFWDRSVDRRGASNSNFFAEGTHDFAAMLAIAKEKFPAIIGRFQFEIVEHKIARVEQLLLLWKR